MIPISESVLVRRTPIITGTLILACIAVFIYELMLPAPALERFIHQWGVTPALILPALTGDPTVSPAVLVTLLTSQFLHGGWLHLIGNMLFLWVFGRAVEDRVGHVAFLGLYLLGGVIAALVQSLVSGPESTIPMIGASGAVAGILGAYLVSFPSAWVTVLVPVFFFFWTFPLPAILVLALWFLAQFFTGVATISEAGAHGGVAYWAHIGGFLFGLVAGFLWPGRGRLEAGSRETVHRVDGPGPAKLVSSLANLIILFLVVRLVLVAFTVPPGPGLIGQIAAIVYLLTGPMVNLVARVIPPLEIGGLVVELPTIVLIFLVETVTGLLIQAIPRSR